MNRDPQAVGSGETWLAADGTVLQMRAIAEGDAAGLVSFVRRLSFGARYFRYGRPDFDLTYERARQICMADPARRLHLLVLAQMNGSRAVVASGRIIFEPGEKHCQLEMVVSDAWQGQGVGRRLLEALIDAARQIGLQEVRATMLVTNTAIASLLVRRGFLVGDAAEGASTRLARLDISSAASAVQGTARALQRVEASCPDLIRDEAQLGVIEAHEAFVRTRGDSPCKSPLG